MVKFWLYTVTVNHVICGLDLSPLNMYPGFRLRNDLYCVGWGVKLYSLMYPGYLRDPGNLLRFSFSIYAQTQQTDIDPHRVPLGSVTITTESRTDGATTYLV